MDELDILINRIYKEEILNMYIKDYVETDNKDVKDELYEKIKILVKELNLI
jgi:hypothetical protein